jgi:hypothetical protein
MSIRSKFHADVGIVFTSVEGVLSFDEIRGHLDSDGRVGEIALPQIFDATRLQTDLTAEERRLVVQRLIEMRRDGRFGPTAVITSDPFAFDLVSALSAFSEMRGGPEVHAFRIFREGLDWLVRRMGNQ